MKPIRFAILSVIGLAFIGSQVFRDTSTPVESDLPPNRRYQPTELAVGTRFDPSSASESCPRSEIASTASLPIDSVRTEVARFGTTTRLPQVAILIGRLIDDSTGEPIGNTKVTVFDSISRVSRESVVDAAGHFEARPFETGHALDLEVRFEGRSLFAIGIEPLEAGTNEREVRVSEQILLRGRVVELDTGRPVTTSVSASRGSADEDLAVRRVAGGTFTVHPNLRALRKGQSNDGDIQIETHTALGFGTTATIPASRLGEDRIWTFFVGRGCRISGTIRDPFDSIGTNVLDVVLERQELGDLVSGDPDRIARSLGSAWRSNPEQRLSSDGRFEFKNVPPRIGHRLVITTQLGVTLRRDIHELILDRMDIVVDIDLPKLTRSVALDVRKNGHPAAAHVEWEGIDISGKSTVGRTGAGSIYGLPACKLRLVAKYVASDLILARDVEIREDTESRVVFEIRDPRSVRGRVVDSSGKPLAGITVGAVVLARSAMSPHEMSSAIGSSLGGLAENGDPEEASGEWLSDGLSGVSISWPDDESPQTFSSFTRTDSEGAFVFSHLAPSDRLRIGIEGPEYFVDPLIVESGSDGISLEAWKLEEMTIPCGWVLLDPKDNSDKKR